MVLYANSQNFSLARGVYVFGMVDVPGTVTANAFFSVMNPAMSGIRHEVVDLRFGLYSIGNVSSPNSLAGYRITGHSGGSVYSPATVEKFAPGMPNPLSEIRISNPTVTGKASTPLVFKSAIIAVGGGNTSATDLPVPQGGSFDAFQGGGFVAMTAAGDPNQRWSFNYTFAEYQL